MTHRTTQKDLYNILARINDVVGFDEPHELWTRDANGKNVATVGMYYLSGSSYGWSLYCVTNPAGGVTTVLSADSKRVMFDKMHAYLAGYCEAKSGRNRRGIE